MTLIIMMNSVCFKVIQAIFMVLLMLQVDLVCAEEVKCIDRERQVLLYFKASMVDEYDMQCLSSWGDEEDKRDCCQWKGVGCSNQTSHVEILDIGYCHLSGKIPISLMELQHLRYLNLSFNYLVGSIPSQLVNLSKLQYLDLNHNALEGTLPYQLGKLSSLQKLLIGQNWGFKFDNGNHIGGQWLSNLTSLTHLDLSSISNLYNSHTLLQMIGKLPKLTELKLSNCSLSDNILLSLGPKFKFSTFLAVLDLSVNTFTSSFIFQWVSNVSSNLIHLDLRDNQLNGELPVIFHHLSDSVRNSLQVLHLEENHINGTLPDFSILPSLKVLFLDQNRLNGKFPRLPSHFETFSVTSNSLEGEITDSHFFNMSKLKLLDLSDNSLTLTFNKNWVPPFQLEYILLRSCKLGPTFPEWLRTQINFTHLDISNAGISDGVPKWFWNLPTNLESLDISNNNLMGTIPNVPIILTEYPTITLAGNQFDGPIPLFLRNAKSLNLSENKFSDYSVFLCANDTAGRFGQIKLSSNHLFGQIPDCWNNSKSLAFLDLSNNNLFGQVPTSIGLALELKTLILRNNSLTGELPYSLRSCTKLVMLDMGDNKLSGLIPSWNGSSLQKLQILSLRRNNFFGRLPLSLCNLTSIQLLDLSSNNLKGRIPKCFKNFFAVTPESFSIYDSRHVYTVNETFVQSPLSYDLIALLMWKGVERTIQDNKFLIKGIDLSSNQLTEEIPAEIENLVGMVLLNLSRNNLTGEIPLKIGRLTSLEFIDLSRNQLVGSIPSSLTQIDRLAMLDLSHNYLSGQIPTSTQLQSFDASSYEDNLDLCGRPLQKLCKEAEPSHEPTIKFREDEDSLFGLGFYTSMAFGFVIGFWGIFGTILLKRSWRHAYFRFLNNLSDNINVMIAVKVAKYKRWLKG